MLLSRQNQQTESVVLADSFIAGVKADSVAEVCEALAWQAVRDTGLPLAYILERLLDHERQSTSGVGGGVAIPHLRLKRLSRPYALCANLAAPVDFSALDSRPVDLVFMLLSPKEDVTSHLRRLSRVSRLLRDEALRAQLRGVESLDACHALFLASQMRLAA